MNINNDAELITKFIQGQTSFAANQDLKIELAFDSTQLLKRQGGVIACLKQEDQLPTVTVRRGCDHWNLLHHTLLRHGFVPLLNTETDRIFAKYQKRELPPGYKLNATDASTLWKEWWINNRSGNGNRVELDILLFTRNKWIEIHDIMCKQGVIFIKTAGAEVVRQVSEPVVWLSWVARNGAEGGISARQSAGQTSASNDGQTVKQESRLSTVGQIEIAPDLSQIVRVHQGKLCITTSLGEIIIEGSNLKIQLSSGRPPAMTSQFPGRQPQTNSFAQFVSIGF